MAYPNLSLYSLFFFWSAFLLLELLLIQGAVYWYIKLQRLKKEKISTTPVHVVKRYKGMKNINLSLFCIPPIMLLVDYFIWKSSLPMSGIAIALFIYGFALLEYINYFYVQLSYDNKSDIQFLLKTKKLKKASIRKDIERITSN